MTSYGLCAPNTTVVDYAYEPGHPLRLGNFPISKHSSLASESDFYDDPQYESYSSDEINSRAIALFDFTPENDNEVSLKEGQEIWVSYRHGQGWLVAEDPETGENGLVPEEYVEILFDEEPEDEPQQFMPHILSEMVHESDTKVGSSRSNSQEIAQKSHEDDWEDTDEAEGDEDATTQSQTGKGDGLHNLGTKMTRLDVT